MATYTRDQFIDKLGVIVNDSDRMILIIPVDGYIEVRSTFFNYADIQRLTYILFRTSCEWWIKPIDEKSVTLKVRLF